MGNICRSPIAEHVLRTEAERRNLIVEVVSAGTGGWHVGDPADHRAQAVLRANGYSYQHRAQQFQASWFDTCDWVLVMDQANYENVVKLARTESERSKVRLLRDFDASSESGAEVPDPYYGGPEDFAETLRLVEAAVVGFIESEFGVK
jgi:protein-tyrosine phosphatase